MSARFNLKTHRDFEEDVYPREPINYLMEFSAELEDWNILNMQGSEIVSDYYLYR